MGLGAEAFSILAILEARDQASEIFEKCGAVLEKFGETAEETAGVVKGAADQIDESLLSTASGADALELAAAKVAAAQDQVTAATDAQAEAEQALLAASSVAASQEDLAVASENLAVAQGRAAAAEAEQTAALAAQRDALTALITENGEAAAATGLMVDANGKLLDSSGRFASAADIQQAAQDALNASQETGAGTADTLAAANDRVAASQKTAADAATELNAAQAKQDALGGGNDAAAAAQNLAGKEKAAQAASKDLASAQAAQAKVQAAATQAANGGAAAAEAEAAAQRQAAADAKDAEAGLASMGKIAGITALGLGVVGVVAVKAAGNFQSATQHLVTDAGTLPDQLQTVRAGILSISSATGTSATDVTNAMYHISSAGITGAAGLKVAQIAAEGAKVGNADLDTVSKALVGTLDTYYGSSTNASNATQRSTSMMNELIAIVGSGDMTMQALTSSLSTVAPIAEKAGISLAQVGGAVATMTSQNMTARQATNDLSHTISSMMNPTSVQTTEMAQMGLNSQKVASQMGKKGLTGTMTELTQAITSHMGPAGTVLMSAFNKSTSAGQDANTMLKQLPSSIQSVAKGYLDGTVSYNTWYTATKALPLQARTMADQFATTAGKAKGFNSILTAGGPAAQTYNAALAKMTGGTVGLKTALMLTGQNASMFTRDAQAAQKAANTGGTSVKNWSAIQGTFNQKLDVAKASIENTGIAIGSALLPTVSALAGGITKIVVPIATWTADHKTLTAVLFVGITAIAATVAAIALAAKAFKAVQGAITNVRNVAKGIQSVWQKLTGVFRKSAAEQEKSAKDAAATQESAAEESAAVQEEQAGEAAASVEGSAGEAAAAEEEAAAESSAGWITAAAQTVAQWAKTAAGMVAQGAVWVAQNTVKVAAVVAGNIAGALSTAAAWVAANAVMTLGIGLVVAAVVAAVILIVKNWSKIVDGIKDAWNACYDFISKIVSDIVNFVKSHWVLILAAMTGPIGLAVAYVVTHFTQIKAFVSKIVSDVISFVRQHWALIVEILEGPLVEAGRLIGQHWTQIEHWFDSGVDEVLSILRGLAHDVVSLGEDIVRGIWSGISGMGGWLWGQVKSFAGNTLHSFESALGIGSPSKYTTVHGLMLGTGLANGITASIPQAVAAAHKMASSVLTATSALTSRSATAGLASSLASSAVAPASAAGGGGVTIQLNVTGNTIMSDSDITKLTQRIGKKLATVSLPASGTRLIMR